ncbi:hypothetical protein ZIOFF_049107 [Zingiber officinale]|uniref:dUTP diphosphatase n=1 Tax=Zingiber officinale TaxID=94328 RepID=A0A8J5KXA5_ZINOF|nr:hypothetical protein ZIOFF_049107 [Zingiber officinale]
MATTRTEQQAATTPLFEDQIRSYRRTQRRLHNAQQVARRIGRQLTGGAATGYTLEQQIEPEAQLQLSMQELASIVPAEGVVDYLTSHGVNALPGRSFSTRSLQGLNWPSEQPVYNNKDEEIQEILAVLIEIKPRVFTNFEGTADEYYEEYGDIDDYIEKGKQIIDQDERYSSTPEPHILVNKISQHATLPQRQTEGSAGLDVSASHAAVIEPYDRDLVHTGLRIEILYGYYGRLASRSSFAWKMDKKIAQLIPEKIAFLEVYEVPHLSYSERGEKGFGSTDKPNTIPEPAQNNASTSQRPRHFTTNDIFSLLMPRETAAVLVQDDSIQNNSEQDQAATTSPWASVPRSLDPTPNYEDIDDSYLDYIAYLASLSTSTQPIWDDYPELDTEWINPFTSKGGGESELIAANCEMEYPNLRRLVDEIIPASEQIYSTSTVISPYRPARSLN